MQKLILPPDQSGYAVKSADEVLRVQLDGGRGRYRKDILNGSQMVNCTWTLDRDNYQYMNVFYRYAAANAGAPFLIDLYLDEPTLTEHEANFMPGTFGLVSQSGLTFTVSAQLEVKPLAYDADYSESYVMLLTEYGSVQAASEILALLEKLVTVDLPEIA